MKSKKTKANKKDIRSLLNKFEPGFIQFGIRALVFLGILFSVYFFVFVFFRHTEFFVKYLKISGDYYFSFLTGLRKRDFINSALFTMVIFFIWNRDLIKTFRPYKQNISETAVFGGLSILSQIMHYLLKYWVKLNPGFNPIILAIFKNLFNVLFVVFLALAVFNLAFIKQQIFKFRKQIPIFSTLLMAYFFIIQFFQNIWFSLGNFIAKAMWFLLGLTFDNVSTTSHAAGPRLAVGDFIVGISKECSGIDSLLLFISLYLVLFGLDHKRMNKKRMLILFVPGVIGTIAYNLLRVYLLMLVALLYDPKFAVDMFHTNIGWILFLSFFIVFWHYGSKWVYLKIEK